MDRDQLEAMSKEELYDLATDADVSGRSSMSKSELVDALDETAPTEAAPAATDARTPGISEAMVEARDAQRAAETEAAEAIEERPIVGGIDPQLEAVREATREADAASAVDVRNAPGVS